MSAARDGGPAHRWFTGAGRLSVRRPWWTIVAWLLVTAAIAAMVVAFGRPVDDDTTMPGSAAQRGRDLLEIHFPGADGAGGQIIVRSTDGPLDQEAVRAAADRIAELDHVSSVTTPSTDAGSLTGDGDTGYLTVQFDVSPRDIGAELTAAVMDAAAPAADQVLPGGTLARPDTDTRRSEALGVGVALVVLVAAFGGLVAAGLPLLTALITLICGLGVIGLAGHLTAVPGVATTLATMIGLGVGIDYALFMITRYRALLATGVPFREAIIATVASSGSAVAFAGGTVIVALAGLSVAGVPILATLGWTAGLTVLVAVAAAVTLLPALLTVLGPRIDSLPIRRRRLQPRARPSMWAALSDRVTRRPWPYALAGTILLLIVAAPVTVMRLGQTDDGDQPPGTAGRAGYDILAAEFGPGVTGPLTVIAELTPPAPVPMALHPSASAGKPNDAPYPPRETTTPPNTGTPTASRAGDATTPPDTGTPGASPARETTTPPDTGTPGASGASGQGGNAPGGRVTDPRIVALVKALEAVPGAERVQPARVSSDGQAVTVRVIPETGPGDPATVATAERLAAVDAAGLDVHVTGPTAMKAALAERVGARMPYVIGLVVVLAALLVLAAFRAPVVAVKAAVMNLFSVAAAYGVLTAVFQWGWGVTLLGLDGPVPIESYVPMLLFALLFGLSMDYEVFLLTAVRESWDATGDNRVSVREGLAATGVVITSAALIMVCVFAGFVLTSSPVVKMTGLGLAVAVAIDATVIRGLLVPATMAMLGRANWWTPGR
ncbi:MMPL family transporter [Actinoplanes sp. NPDC049802]|uniref:MMPL family transporter n=1 Tax=Actinoplanes sp. NPDC049802 TaxID=3154742 RepID=UPI003408233B